MASAASAPEPAVVVHQRRPAGPRTPPVARQHQHHFLALLLVGDGSYRVGKAEILPGGRPLLNFLPAGDDDVDGLTGPVDSWYTGFAWPGLSARAIGPIELDLAWGDGRARVPRYKSIAATEVPRLVDTFTRLRAASQREDLAGRLAASAALMELFAAYVDLPGAPGAALEHRALARFRDLLEARACDDVSIEALAAEAGVSADHLRELFRKRYGARPVEYRTGLRLAKARDLLAGTAHNVGEIARRVGYADPLYFSRVFKRRFGLSPIELVRRFRMAR
jgi:AraC-like DNA-binding protein